MALFKSGNPALGENTFTRAPHTVDESQRMTINGTVNKTAFLLLLILGAGALSWNWVMRSGNVDMLRALLIGNFIVSVGIAVALIYKKEWAPYLAPVYAIVNGLALGGLSAIYNAAFDGIVAQALLLTLAILGALLLIYRAGLIKATENFKLIVASATAGIAIFYLISFGLSMFGVSVPLIHSNSGFGILFSLGVVVIASLNLVMDFDFIEQGEAQGAPKFMEWYGAFGLMVTLIWLYIEILRLLAKLQSRN